MRRRLRAQPPRHHNQDPAGRLGRLLDRPVHRLHLGRGARRLHQPPGPAPRVRGQRVAGGLGALHPPRRAGPVGLSRAAAVGVGPRRPAVRPAQGLGHGEPNGQPGPRRQGRGEPGRTAHHALEPARRRQLRAGDTPPDAGHPGPQRPASPIRPPQRRRLRLPGVVVRRHGRPGGVEPLRLEQRVPLPGPALGAALPLQRPAPGRDAGLAGQPAGQGPVGAVARSAASS